MSVKYVFVTGGVVSGLGKGITAASLGRLLKARGYKVTMQKFDPYINIDPGTMNPIQHGEVFVPDDGAETDLDLGHYGLKIPLSQPVRFTGPFCRKNAAEISAVERYRSSLISPMRSRAVSIAILHQTKPALRSLKLAVRSAISKVSRSWNPSVSSSTMSDMKMRS